MKSSLELLNGQSADITDIPQLTFEDFKMEIMRIADAGGGIASLFARPVGDGSFIMTAILEDRIQCNLQVLACEIGKRYPSLTISFPQAHWFEREIAEHWGIVPEGHPWLKPIRYTPISNNGSTSPPNIFGQTEYFKVEGKEVHEVAVGPVHAGVIEPGHFRFQCHGETVHHLEISLGYQHRGVERGMSGGPNLRSIHYMETLSGDTTIGHTTAYCQAIEALTDCTIPARGAAIRGIALELERIANHIGDLGALAGDVAYLPTASYCGRLRGDVLNLTAMISGNRFGRGLICPGGVTYDIDNPVELSQKFAEIMRDTGQAVNMLWDTPSVMARFERTGQLTRDDGEKIGLVGLAARACGIERDIRNDFPLGIYCFSHIPVSTWSTGDVFARAYVRWLEIQRSAAFINDQLLFLPPGNIIQTRAGEIAPNRIAVSLCEGWRGEICHVAITDKTGKFSAYNIVDPSFHNWFGLAYSLRNQQISDFPLCNKSFSLSYCGHDL
ncbi:MAG: NADH-quinone oxidoreductase subunit C [Pseudomonadota bacterium]